ncbi:hypothetical protein WMY93_031730 [Mugilogobius chulae]|uniref:Uncharacterized protein n=1 Tax=Mugilogobius chulae TaxID=88201 RepID=A0AAW0MH96_9GOBI
MPFLWCLCAFVLFSLAVLGVLWASRRRTSLEPPYLPSLPLIGSLLSLRSPLPPHLLFKQLQDKYGATYSLKLGSHKVVMVNHHTHAKEVLLKKGKAFAGRPRTGRSTIILGLSLCRSPVPVHPVVRSVCSRPVSGLSPELTRAVTNVICALCFHSSYSRGDPEFEAMLNYSQGIMFPNKDLQLLKHCVSIRDQLLQKKYEEHKADYSDHVQRDLLDALLRAKRSAENNNTAEFSLAPGGLTGVETTTTVLKWAVAYLIHHPQVQKRIQEEMDQIVGLERAPQLKDRGSLPYLEATIREVLRIRPVAPLFIPHVALNDTSIGDFNVTKGTRVVINLWSLHHDPKEWPNPDNFEPARFLNSDASGLSIPSPSYLPFGAGLRVCLGEALAKMELFLFLSTVLQRFTLAVRPGDPLPNLEGKFGVVLQPARYFVSALPRPAWGTDRRV